MENQQPETAVGFDNEMPFYEPNQTVISWKVSLFFLLQKQVILFIYIFSLSLAQALKTMHIV